MTQDEIALSETIDAGATACGELILLVFQRSKTLLPGQLLCVIAHDEGAAIDIPAWCRSTGNTLIDAQTAARPMTFTIRKNSNLSA